MHMTVGNSRVDVIAHDGTLCVIGEGGRLEPLKPLDAQIALLGQMASQRDESIVQLRQSQTPQDMESIYKEFSVRFSKLSELWSVIHETPARRELEVRRTAPQETFEAPSPALVQQGEFPSVSIVGSVEDASMPEVVTIAPRRKLARSRRRVLATELFEPLPELK